MNHHLQSIGNHYLLLCTFESHYSHHQVHELHIHHHSPPLDFRTGLLKVNFDPALVRLLREERSSVPMVTMGLTVMDGTTGYSSFNNGHHILGSSFSFWDHVCDPTIWASALLLWIVVSENIKRLPLVSTATIWIILNRDQAVLVCCSRCGSSWSLAWRCPWYMAFQWLVES